MLAERIGKAIRSRAPEANKSGWQAECADKLGVHEETFKNWQYGKSAPTAEGLMGLFDLFGVGFVAEILAPLGLHVSEDRGPVPDDAAAKLAAIKEILDG